MRQTIKILLFFLMVLTAVVYAPQGYAEIPIPSLDIEKSVEPVKRLISDKGKILEVGDRVIIKVYPEDQYIKGVEMEISSEGNVILPLVGKVTIAGMPLVDAERKLVAIINADYLVNPEVVIEVVQLEEEIVKDTINVSVLGSVRAPSNYDLPVKKGKNPTLIQAVLQAGGFSDVANIKKIKIVRKGLGDGNEVIRANAENIVSGKKKDIELQNGDIIHVSESLF